MVKRLEEDQIKDFLKKADFLTGESMIIGGSSLFHGAPLLSLQVASRFNKTVFFVSPEEDLLRVAQEAKSRLFAFIWAPFDQVDDYLVSVDIALIGPGFMRYFKQKQAKKYYQKPDRRAGKKTKKITERLLKKFSSLPWVIDAGSLQVIDKKTLPPKSIITPNNEEFALLFGENLNLLSLDDQIRVVSQKAKENNCLIISKNPDSIVASREGYLVVSGGNRGLEKGGTGDVLAGLVMALSAKTTSPLISSAVAVWLFKKASQELFKQRETFYNADDLAQVTALVAKKYLT